MFLRYPPNALELLINSQIAFQCGKRYGECFNKTIKNHVLNTITVCSDWVIISVGIMQG